MEIEKIKTENRLTIMEQKIDNLTSTVNKIDEKLDKHVEWETEKYEKLDAKYAGKWVEKLTLAIAGGLIVAVIMLLMNKL